MNSREGMRPARHAVIAAVFLTCAVVLGGGGSPNPGTEVVLQLAFATAAATWVWMPAPGGVPPLPSRSVWLTVALVLALPLAQLVPLPPSLWHHLDAQRDRAAALALVGRDSAWQPWARSPSLTLAALLAMIPALFTFAATASLDIKGRRLLLGVIATMAVLTALIGAMQVSMGSEGLNFYRQYTVGAVTGFQANRNSTADVLLIGLVAAAAFLAPALAADGRRGSGILANCKAVGIAATGVLLVLLFAVVLTASRTGIALIPLALLGVWIIMRPVLAEFGRWRFLPPAAAGVLALFAVLGMFATQTTLAGVANRFDFTNEFRIELWRDGWFAMQRAWPFGVGVGGALPAMIASERLEILGLRIPNRVHNDYIEFALEAGVAGFAVLAMIILLLARLTWRTWREQPEQRALVACGVTMLAVVAAHSLVDYPLRSMALACLAGTGAGLLVAAPRAQAHRNTAADGSGR